MEQFNVVAIQSRNVFQQKQVETLLNQENIRKDKLLEYTCGIFNEQDELIATGSYYRHTIRCVAVDSRYQGYGLMNKVITHLLQELYAVGTTHVFVYTKSASKKMFEDLGFYEIVHITDEIVFMETKARGFSEYMAQLHKNVTTGGKVAAIVMNANPFTLGHQYLVETAAKENDHLHIFVVEEDVSEFPYAIRKELVEKGVSHLHNVSVHSTGPYLISSATFPSYFQKDDDAVIQSQVNVDAYIFIQIAKSLNITKRYVGTEPYSHVTNLYNTGLKDHLSESGIELIELVRKDINEQWISASKVRLGIKENGVESIKHFVPETTYQFLISEEAQSVLQTLAQKDNVVHY